MALTVVDPAGALRVGWKRSRPASAFGSEVATEWFDLALDLVQRTPGFSPPVAARAFGYAGVSSTRRWSPACPVIGVLPAS
jgi:hypothetical protein